MPAPPASETAVSADELARREALLERLDNWATNMDARFRIPFTPIRFGIDPLVGLFPGLGPLLGLGLSAYIFGAAYRYRLPPSKFVRMASNMGIEFIIGILPVVGPMFDVYWRANIKNVDLLREYLTPEAAAREARKERLLRLRQLGILLLVAGSLALIIYAWKNESQLLPDLRHLFHREQPVPTASQGSSPSSSSRNGSGSQVLVPLRMF